MHDGRFNTLFEVVNHYNRNSANLPVRALPDNESAAVVAFLKSLTAQTRDLTSEKLKRIQEKQLEQVSE